MEKRPITGDKIPHPVGGRWTTCWSRRRAAAPSTPCGQRAPTSPQPSDLGKPASRRGGCGRPWDNEESPQGVEAANRSLLWIPAPRTPRFEQRAAFGELSPAVGRPRAGCGAECGGGHGTSVGGLAPCVGDPGTSSLEGCAPCLVLPRGAGAGAGRAEGWGLGAGGSRGLPPAPEARACLGGRVPERCGCRSGAGAGNAAVGAAERGQRPPATASPRRRQPAVRRQPFLMRLVSSVTWL